MISTSDPLWENQDQLSKGEESYKNTGRPSIFKDLKKIESFLTLS